MNRLFLAMVSAMTALHAGLAFANVSEGPADRRNHRDVLHADRPYPGVWRV